MSFNYCTLNDVKGQLFGLDTSDMPTTLLSRIETDWIPLMKREVDSFCGENFDLTSTREFYDGNDLTVLPLRHRPIRQIDNALIRIIPGIKWFQFKRWFVIKDVDSLGVTIALKGGVSPIGTAVPPYTYAVGSGLTPTSGSPTANFANTDVYFSESDVHVDAANGFLVIPPRTLFIEAQGTPFWNYTWIRGNRNIEVAYQYGYKDIDSLPLEIRIATAKLVAAEVLSKKAMWVSAGTKSISIEEVSRSFGEGAYSTEIKDLRESAYNILRRYKRINV